MAGSHGDGDLIAAIYDAIIDPSRWEEVVKRIVDATKSVADGLHILQPHAASLSATCNADPFYNDAYVQHYYKANTILAAPAIAPGEVWAATHITQADAYKTSAFLHEFGRPQGWADLVAVGLVRAPKTYGVLSLQRSPEAI